MKLKYKDIAPLEKGVVNGFSPKDLMVLHETISPDATGYTDIDGVVNSLVSRGYGIHGLTDAEGNVAWAYGLGNAIFWQAGGVNTRSVGIEQVSNIPQVYKTNAARKAAWLKRMKQLRATAKTIAAWHNVDPENHPIVFSDGTKPGVTSHWNVSQHFALSAGHWDCFPAHQGGHYPMLTVIRMAKVYAKLGFRF